MLDIRGKYNTAKVFTDVIESEAISQIMELCNQPSFEGLQIRIMPDVHAGAGCTVGTTLTIKDKVIPNLVGVDIGCGMEVANLGNVDIDYKKLDEIIRTKIPFGCNIREKAHSYAKQIDLSEFRCKNDLNIDKAEKSIGSLGGGNHFIEVDIDDDGNKYLVIHSGSRHLGLEVCKHYQREAFREIQKRTGKDAQKEIIDKCKREGRLQDISDELKSLKPLYVPKDLAYCEGKLFDDYIHDMKIAQKFAMLNRLAMKKEILDNLGLKEIDSFTTLHNYIDTDNMILRKGSVSAQNGEKLIIPINMRDGSLICVGKGNPDWNYSAPHGAGRLMSRSEARHQLSLDEFQKSMEGIFTTSVGYGTIDESPMAYKSINDIVDNIHDTVDIVKIIKPLYNFKASDIDEKTNINEGEEE